jgi:hypothetical protein
MECPKCHMEMKFTDCCSGMECLRCGSLCDYDGTVVWISNSEVKYEA